MDKNDKADIFLSVVQSNKGIIYKVANSYCKNIEDRKDLFQEIIIQLWKSFDNYDDNFKHSTWMYRISLNVAISFYRKENSRKMSISPYPADGILSAFVVIFGISFSISSGSGQDIMKYQHSSKP